MSTTDLLVFNPIAHTPLINLYIEGVPLETLAMQFSLPLSTVLEVINLPESKRLQTSIISNIGYNSASRRALLIERMIEKKLEESDGEALSSKDLSSLIRLSLDNAKAEKEIAPKTQVNVDQSKTTQYGSLLQKIYDVEEAEVVIRSEEANVNSI